MMRRHARRCRGEGRSLCATMRGGSIRHEDIRHQRRSISVRPYSSLSSLSLFFVLTMGYASIFNLVEGRDLGNFMEAQDDSANKLEAKLRGHRNLMKGRHLQVSISVLTFAPA